MANMKKRFIKLESADHMKFEMDPDVLKCSGRLTSMVASLGGLRSKRTVHLYNVNGYVLGLVLEWAHLNKGHSLLLAEVGPNKDEIPPWDILFFQKHRHDLHKIIRAAEYLAIGLLLHRCPLFMSKIIKGKTPEEIRTMFYAESDVTPEGQQVQAELPSGSND